MDVSNKSYRISYITEDREKFETNDKSHKLTPGSFLISFPGQSHIIKRHNFERYNEKFIDFDGVLVNHFLEDLKVNAKKPNIECKINSETIKNFYSTYDLAKNEVEGFQQIAAGMIIQLFGQLVYSLKQNNYSACDVEKMISKAQLIMKENVYDNIDMIDLAAILKISYSNFRKLFKNQTGIAPHQYFIDIKLEKAVELLTSSNMSIKEIAYELNFQTVYYFSRIFKKKMNINPSEIRSSMNSKRTRVLLAN